MSGQDVAYEEDEAMRRRPSYIKFAKEWLSNDPIWKAADASWDDDLADSRAWVLRDEILKDYKETFAE